MFRNVSFLTPRCRCQLLFNPPVFHQSPLAKPAIGLLLGEITGIGTSLVRMTDEGMETPQVSHTG